MNRIPSSERIQKQLGALLEGEWANGDALVTKLILMGAKHLGDYERREESNANSGYRNDHRPAKMSMADLSKMARGSDE